MERKPKLIIWDLDNTFWYGVLSEGPPRHIEQNHHLVKELNQRGIINSIASNNIFESCRDELISIGMWDEFIFPIISLESKGPVVKRIIDTLQFRPADVLLLDDEASNLAEAKFYCENIMVSSGDYIKILHELVTTGIPPNDAGARFKQYRELSLRKQKSVDFSGGAREFLRDSDIKIRIGYDVYNHISRIIDLLNRSNQLNFTKRRVNAEEFEIDLERFTDVFYIEAQDKYGYFGIVGFVAITEEVVDHFAFSCRILNMGIEQTVYDFISRPDFVPVGEVACARDNKVVDWITLVDTLSRPHGTAGRGVMILKGGCDLEKLSHYLSEQFEVVDDLNYVNAHGIPVHLESLISIRERSSSGYSGIADALRDFCFLDSRMGLVASVEKAPEFMFLSLTVDYMQGVYECRRSGARITFWDWKLDATDNEHWATLNSRYGLQAKDAEAFSKRFRFRGGVSIPEFKANLRWLIEESKLAETYIFLNGVEFETVDVDMRIELQRNRAFNQALEEVTSDFDNCYVCDVRKVVTTQEQCQDNIRHFWPHCYKILADNLFRDLDKKMILKPWTSDLTSPSFSTILKNLEC